MHQQFMDMVSKKTACGNFANLLLGCIWGHRGTELDFEVKGKGQGYGKTTSGERSTLGGLFSPVSGIHEHISMKLLAVTRY